MPPRKLSKSAISAPTASAVTATAYKFHLPALDIPQTSLTEGTQIPAPIKEPTPPISPPQTPLSTDSPNPLRSHPTSSHSLSRKFSGDALKNLNAQGPSLDTNVQGQLHAKRAYTPSPASSPQPSAKRPHIRKLLSLKSLASMRSSSDVSRIPSNQDGSYTVDIRSSSPSPSTSTTTSTFSKMRRRSSAFWRKNSGLGQVNEEDTVMSGTDDMRRRTPPPTIPEFDSLGGGLQTEQEQKNGTPMVKRVASGFFGGTSMFDGIGRR